jgi:phage-related protein
VSTLTIDVVTDATAAAADLDQVAAAARGAGDAVDAAGAQASTAGSNFEGLGDGADNVASKSSQAAGAMGDLAGGLDAIGATGAATALEGVGLATQVAAGAGDIMNLVAETSIGRFVLQTAAAIAHRTATIAGAVATGTMSAAQAALNVVMSANPVLIVVIALAALTAGLILAYKNSETFRDIVQGVFSAAKGYVMVYVDAIKLVISIFADLPESAHKAWDAVSGFATDAWDKISRKIDDFTGSLSTIASTIAGYFTSAFAPIQHAIDLVGDLIYKLTHLPHVDLNPLNRSLPTGTEGPGQGTGTKDFTQPPAPVITIPITVNGAIDKDGTARTILELLQRYGGRSLAFDAVPS